MPTYALLANPGHNRVYFEQSKKLALAELEIACCCMEVPCGGIRLENIGGIAYVVFSAQGELDQRELATLSRLSFVYAIFMWEGEGLYPVQKQSEEHVEESIGTILRYSGKTNELFTRLLINLALFSGQFAGRPRTVLLDPVAGKGTTLFEGLVAGHDCMGIEIGDRAVHECCVYLKKFLENGRYKHTYHKEKRSGEQKSFTATLHRFELARTKEAFQEPDRRLRLSIVSGDTRYADRYFKKNSVHMIVGDLPYGVAHGNVTREKTASVTRSPGELLEQSLPAWRGVLKKGGAVALAWNAFVLDRGKVELLLERAGFAVLREGPYAQLEHRVDQSIKRDIVVARLL